MLNPSARSCDSHEVVPRHHLRPDRFCPPRQAKLNHLTCSRGSHSSILSLKVSQTGPLGALPQHLTSTVAQDELDHALDERNDARDERDALQLELQEADALIDQLNVENAEAIQVQHKIHAWIVRLARLGLEATEALCEANEALVASRIQYDKLIEEGREEMIRLTARLIRRR